MFNGDANNEDHEAMKHYLVLLVSGIQLLAEELMAKINKPSTRIKDYPPVRTSVVHK